MTSTPLSRSHGVHSSWLCSWLLFSSRAVASPIRRELLRRPLGERSEIPNLNWPQEGRNRFVQPRRWANCDRYCPKGPEPFELKTDYLYPKLQEGIDHYVTSCWGGGTELQLKSERQLRVSGRALSGRARRATSVCPSRPERAS